MILRTENFFLGIIYNICNTKKSSDLDLRVERSSATRSNQLQIYEKSDSTDVMKMVENPSVLSFLVFDKIEHVATFTVQLTNFSPLSCCLKIIFIFYKVIIDAEKKSGCIL